MYNYEIEELIGRAVFALGIFILLCVAFWFSFIIGIILLGLVLIVTGLAIGDMIQ